MGLSSKQVSSREVDWNHTMLEEQNMETPRFKKTDREALNDRYKTVEHQQSEDVNCPRCDSTNTKFCYYNNYNKSQPRHFCRACKRHWTKGGTLRNVPVGGVRKNKRLKKSTSISTPKTSKTTISTPITTTSKIQTLHQKHNQKTKLSSIYQPQIHQSSSFLTPQNLISTKDQPQSNNEEVGIGNGNGMFLSSSMNFPQNQSFLFPFSNSSSLRSSNVCNYGEEFKIMEDSSISNNVMASTSGAIAQPWEIGATTTSSGMEMSNYWSWEDIDSLVSTDLNVPWDDSDIKP